jgi:hypothetical protein
LARSTAGAYCRRAIGVGVFHASARRVDALQAAAREKSLLLARSDEKRKATEQTLATLLAGRGNVVLVNLNTTASTGPGMQVFWNCGAAKSW